MPTKFNDISTRPSLEDYFQPYRENIIGAHQEFLSPYGKKRILYADWIASGRLYKPIEDIMASRVAPFVGNTHTQTSTTGSAMTKAYYTSKQIIKKHVNAGKDDILISSNSGMTGVVNKFQRILGLRLHESFYRFRGQIEERPVVFISHMEHHSNQTSWLETIADVEVINPDENGLVDLRHFAKLLVKHANRKNKIAAVTSCSNVTGIFTPYHKIAEMIHKAGGVCFVDFACSAPYIKIDMHPADHPGGHLDAIYFSPHKFLGGPGSSGILIFNQKLYNNKIPDNPGGGTVDWTNPWGEHKYYDEIEDREDGGTPGFLQTIRVALCIQLKEQMTVSRILDREHEIFAMVWPRLKQIPNLNLLADNVDERLGVLSFYINDLHYNLGVKLLNDRFGIQVRGGCSCAGTYGHYLLRVSYEQSKNITEKINTGDLTLKPGWIRLSLHPVMTDDEVEYIVQSIEALCKYHGEWAQDYVYNISTNEYDHKEIPDIEQSIVNPWFTSELL